MPHWVVYIGYLASALVFAAFFMKTPRRLRQVAICSNVAFITYGIVDGQLPLLILHTALLPLNITRLVQLERQIRTIRQALSGEIPHGWFHAFTERHVFDAGAYLFRKGEPGGRIYFVSEGRVSLIEIEHVVEAGQLLGEMAMFAPNRTRSLSALAETRVVAYSIDAEALTQLFHRNPQFALYLVQLITQRLLDDMHLLEGIIAARTAERERFRRLAAIDEVTGLPNGEALQSRLRTEWARGTRIGASPLSLVVAARPDGRPGTNEEMIRLAELVVRSASRSADLVARRDSAVYALLPGTPSPNADAIASEIAEGARDAGIPVVVCAATRVPERTSVAETLLFDADEQLLQRRLALDEYAV